MLVAAFNVIDSGGDRIVPGASADELKAWEASGNTKSVNYSHGTDNAGPTKSSRPVGPSVRRAR